MSEKGKKKICPFTTWFQEQSNEIYEAHKSHPLLNYDGRYDLKIGGNLN